MTETAHTICAGIPQDQLSKLRKEFLSNERHRFAQDICHQFSIRDAAFCPKNLLDLNHIFNIKVDEAKPITNQKSSGRCWIFACLNQLRIPFIEKYDLVEFEFSEAYLFFWDKLERSNFILDAFIDCGRKGNFVGSREVDHLLVNASDDGGQWDMLTNLIIKYGLVPKNIFPDTASCEVSRHLVNVIGVKMREFCKILHEAILKGVTDADLKLQKDDMLKQLYTILSIALGSPPTSFTWEYYNKSKQYKKIESISPQEFYNEHLKSCFDITEMVCLVNDTRPCNPFNKLYTVDYLGNMVGGRQVLYINQPIEELKKYAVSQLKEKRSVWFGCDHSYQCQLKPNGALDIRTHDYKKVFGCKIHNLNKSDRLIYRESLMTHAMLFTGVSTEGDKILKWRVENSWGDEDGDKGYLVMTDDWFSEYVYEVVVHKKYISEEIRAILEQKPIVLPAWDPMGSLAKGSA